MPDERLLPILDEDELARRFAKLKPRLTANEAGIEAARCLFCHDAPCIRACPTSIDIPMFIRQIMSGDPKGSARTIFTQNILGKSCGEVCPTEVLCEGACVYHELNRQPIDIGRLQAYATGHAIDHNIRFFTKGPPTGKRVAIIGAGPAGLACAHELTRLGHEAEVFDAHPTAGGLNAYGVAPYKFSNRDAAAEVEYIRQIGFTMYCDRRVSSDELVAMAQDYDAVFLGIGLGSSRRLGLPGEDLPQVYGAAEFIQRLRAQEQRIAVGRQVVVVGAGNTAIDAAVECAKLGAEVTIVYRRGPAEQSAYDFEVELAKRHGVRLHYFTNPIAVLGNGTVTGLRCARTQRRAEALTTIPDSEWVLPCDMVLFATGQTRQEALLRAIPGLRLDAGRVVVNADYQTTHEKFFAGGDCVNGGAEVVNAAAHGRDTARGIDRYLRRKEAL